MIASHRFYRSLARKASLIYVSDEGPGITRRRQGRGFAYFGSRGRRIRDARLLDRIRSLAVPPAWKEVWICPDPDGHLQATGRDDRSRKQYRYHPRWQEAAGLAKYASLYDFAKTLPRVRRRVAKDLRSTSPRTRALAAIVRLIDRGRLRVGGEVYARENRSHGAVTLERRHVEIVGDRIQLRFQAKSAVTQEIELQDASLALALKRLVRTRRKRLFAYADETGETRQLSADDVNAYLQEIAGAPITAKDFRTWHGSVVALMALAGHADEPPSKKWTDEAIRAAAAELGNTVATCRKHYVHPDAVEAYVAGELPALLRRSPPAMPSMRKEERLLAKLLEKSTRT